MYSAFNYKIVIFAVLIFLIINACRKIASGPDVISLRATSAQVLADGSSLDTIYAGLTNKANDSSTVILFQASSGLFGNGFDTMSVAANRVDIDPKKFTAIAIFKASLRNGLDTITAATNTSPQVVNRLTLNLNTSIADSIALTSSSFSVKDSFASEVTITGTLFNKQGGMVSLGTKVLFFDQFTNGTSAGGSYRQTYNYSNDTSQVSTIYSPGLVPANQFINFIAVGYDSSGNVLARDTTRIYVLP